MCSNIDLVVQVGGGAQHAVVDTPSTLHFECPCTVWSSGSSVHSEGMDLLEIQDLASRFYLMRVASKIQNQWISLISRQQTKLELSSFTNWCRSEVVRNSRIWTMSYSPLILLGSKGNGIFEVTEVTTETIPETLWKRLRIQVICAIWMFLESILLWALVEYCPLFLEPRLFISVSCLLFFRPDIVIQMPPLNSFSKEAKMLFFWWLALWPQKHWMQSTNK